MPISSFRLARLMLASGLLMLATFASAKAQETPLDPNAPDILLPAKQTAGFVPVTQLASPENDYQNCAPAPAAWHPPIFYPNPTLYCPTGVVARDWWREKTLGCQVSQRQRMLEKDYQWRVENGAQPTCCPPHSCWGHACECCPGVGCRESWFGFGGCEEGPCAPCGNPGCTQCTPGQPTSMIAEPEFELAVSEQVEDQVEPGLFVLVSDERPAGNENSGIETAGFFHVTDCCTQGKGCANGSHCWNGGHCWNGWHGGRHYCPLHRCYDDCDECDDDHDCDCIWCRWRCRCHDFHNCLYCDCPGDWRREMPFKGCYYMAYPVNPYHFDQRDGRIYAAQGYGHPVGVPLAPNVQHTYNYGWGLPSSRLSPVSRMPGAPGVANPAVPEAAGPGIYPPAFPYSN